MVLVLGKVMQSEMQTYLFDVLKLDHERYSQHKDHQPAFFTNVLAGFVEAPFGSVDDSCSPIRRKGGSCLFVDYYW